jgi:hypothetical protein
MEPEVEDPVAEIRAIRRELSERFGDDVNALCDFLAEQEQQHPERLVNHPPRAGRFGASRQ